MNYLAHHFVISALNECIDRCDTAPDTPHMTLSGAITRLYLSYSRKEYAIARDNEDLLFDIEVEQEEAAHSLLHYASNTDTRSLITEVYEILDEFEARAQQYEQLRRTKTVVIDNRTSTNA